jgi:hypothetical protein
VITLFSDDQGVVRLTIVPGSEGNIGTPKSIQSFGP